MWPSTNRYMRRSDLKRDTSGLKTVCALALLLAIYSPGLLQAQYNSQFINYSLTGRNVGASFEYEAGSNGFSTELANKLIWGGYIDKNLKERAAKHLHDKNNFGIMLNYEASSFFKGGKSYDFLIGFKNQEVINSTYSRDFYNLMFNGNQMFKGLTADISNCSVNALRFQEVKFGAIMNGVDSVGKIGVSISVLKGEQLFYVKTQENSGLYTSPDGRELIFTSNFNMALSDTNSHGIGGFNGIGASADLYFETPYTGKLAERSVLMVNASNIGFIHWWKNSVQYSSDSVLHFSGYNIDNIGDLRDSTISQINADSALRTITNARNEDFNVNIPANLLIVNKMYFGRQRLAASLGFRYVFNANYRPYFFVEPEYHVHNWAFALHAAYGGYTNVSVGLSLAYNSKHVYWKLGSNSLQGFFFPQAAYGHGIFASAAIKLK